MTSIIETCLSRNMRQGLAMVIDANIDLFPTSGEGHEHSRRAR